MSLRFPIKVFGYAIGEILEKMLFMAFNEIEDINEGANWGIKSIPSRAIFHFNQ